MLYSGRREKRHASSGNSVTERAASSALLQTRGQVTWWFFLDILGKETVCLKRVLLFKAVYFLLIKGKIASGLM